MGGAGIVRVTAAGASLSGRVRNADVSQHEGASLVPLSGPGRQDNRILTSPYSRGNAAEQEGPGAHPHAP